MDFKNRVEDVKFYNKLRNYSERLLYNLNNSIDINEKKEIFSWAIEQSLVKNLEIIDDETFTRGYFKNEVKWRWLNLCNKKKWLSEEYINKDSQITDYEEVINPNEKLLKENMNLLKENTELFPIFVDKYYNSLKISALMEKYKLKRRALEKKITKINTILKGTMVIKEYNGICRIKEGQIDKVYESALATLKDGFNRNLISKCVRKGGGVHKGYTWKYIKDFKSNQPEKL